VELKEKDVASHIALLFVQLCFGTAPVLGKFALQTFSPYSIVGFRVGGAAIAFYFLQRFSGNLRLERKKDYLYFALFALIGIVLNQLLFFKGLSLTTATNTSLIAVTIPIFTIGIGSLLGTDSFTWLKGAGISVAAIGVIILINPLNASFNADTTLGDICIILNSLAWAFYVAVSKKFLIKYGVLKSIAWLFIFASLLNVPIGLYFMRDLDVTAVKFSAWLFVAGIVLFPTILAYYTNAWALARVEPSIVTVYVYLQPLIGFFSAVIFLGEKISTRPIISALLIFTGVFLVTRKSNITIHET
jgi:drug/metabolite transporter (DMT)-like permease